MYVLSQMLVSACLFQHESMLGEVNLSHQVCSTQYAIINWRLSLPEPFDGVVKDAEFTLALWTTPQSGAGGPQGQCRLQELLPL